MENYTRWDDFLVAEHEMIERAMAVLKINLEKIDEAIKTPLQMQRAIDFLLEFGDKIHNTKEENFLFPLMGQKGLPVQGGPIGVMLILILIQIERLHEGIKRINPINLIRPR